MSIESQLGEIPYPWERQPRETAKAFDAFTRYRDLPPLERSLQRVASEFPVKVTKGWLGEWSVKWDWVERAAAWDAEVDRRGREKFVQERERMGIRHAHQAMALQEALMLPAKALSEKLRQFPQETLAALSALSVAELLSLITQATRVFGPLMQAERLARDGVTAPPPPVRPSTVDPAHIESDAERMLAIVEAFEEAGIEWPTSGEEAWAEQVSAALAEANGEPD